jgi:peptide/nickel transport system substrate-binding protein
MTHRLKLVLATLFSVAWFATSCSSSKSTVDTSATASSSAAPSDSATPPVPAAGSGKPIEVLRTAFFNDMQVPDPDVFYEVEGNQVTMSTYEGLLRYKLGGTTEIEPLLAKSYAVSSDALTYTFKLQSGVTFVDGTSFDSSAAKFSFERRLKVNNAPAYMLTDIASYETPDPLTFIIKMKKPVSAFLDYLACPYGPKMVSPALIKANEKKDDAAQDWIRTHSAGTGPYEIDEFTLGQRYVLKAVSKYWGAKPMVGSIDIAIIPDASTQTLQLEGGDLDFVHAPPLATIESFKGKAGFDTVKFPAFQKTVLKINPNKAPFGDKALRQALRQAIDRTKLVADVFGDIATVSKSMLPGGMLPDGLGKDAYSYDPAPLKALVAKLPADQRNLTLNYAQFNVNDARLAEAVSAELKDAGLTVIVKPITTALLFDLRNTPQTAPNLLIETANPDASHPDTYERIFYSTEGFLNYLKASVPAADAEMDLGLASVDVATMQGHYSKAAELLFDDATFITIADVQAVYLVRQGITGFGSTAAAPLSLNASSVSDEG